jgi:lariat debranching enzyme
MTFTMPTDPVVFAAVGDVHGRMHAMVRLLCDWERRTGARLRFVLQVGDFEPTRDAEDLATMPVPEKYRSLGDFADYHEGRSRFPWPVWFIGGNHEPFGFLESMCHGGAVADNCRFIGRAERIVIGGMRVAALSGIAPPASVVRRGRGTGYKSCAYFTDKEVDRVLAGGPADILMLHDWPDGAATVRDAAGKRRGAGIGNDRARALVDLLAPRIVIAGHMHWAHRADLSDRSRFVGLAHVDKARDAFAVFRRETDGAIVEIAE